MKNTLKWALALALIPALLTGCEITKTVSPNPGTVGQPLTFTITLVNDEIQGFIQASVEDALPAGLEFVSATSDQGNCVENGGSVTCEVEVPGGNEAEPGVATVTIVVIPRECGDFTNTARATLSEENPTLAELSEETPTVAESAEEPEAREASANFTVQGCGQGGGGGGAGGGGAGGATPITQEGEQDSEAGEIDQSFEVS